MASARGRCPSCRKEYADLWDHIVKKHKDVRWTPADLRGTTLLACPCGSVARSAHGLKAHQGKAKCSGLAQRQEARQSGAFVAPRSRVVSAPVRVVPHPSTPPPVSPTAPLGSPPFTPAVPLRRASMSIATTLADSEPRVSRARRLSAPPTPAPAHADLTFMSWSTSDVESADESVNAEDEDDLSLRFLDLVKLPTAVKPLVGSQARLFADAADRLACAFVSDPSDTTLFDFLCLPKVGLAPGLRANVDLKQRLVAFPNVPWPDPPSVSDRSTRHPTTVAEAVGKQVEAGRLSRAARLLSDSSNVAALTPEVLEELERKHPAGPDVPFGSAPGPSPGMIPKADIIESVFRTFKMDTAPGVSGWTQPLLSVALRRPAVVKMVSVLVGLVAQGSAPGQQLLCASRLTPLAKPDGGVRPIAVGELLFRLIAKVLLRHYFKPDMLLPVQLGVGSRGGTEPIVRAVERALADDLPQRYTHLVSLDFANAFNTVDRCELAAALRDYAPALYRSGRWMYGRPTKLIVTGADGTIETLDSRQGVRQGDPFGPLFFSLGIRRTLEDLRNHLGPDRLLLGYLDDIYILSPDDSALEDVKSFFDTRPASSLLLNVRKCTTFGLEDIRADGINILGTAVGSAEFRSRFLSDKIERQVGLLHQLSDLKSQHALLLLRYCVQQDLRHLQRSLRTVDLPDCWTPLDDALLETALLLRASPRRLDTDADLVTLPTRMGGLGLLSHSECAPHAYAAAADAADQTLGPALGLDVDDDLQVVPQRERCQKAFVARHGQLLSRLSGLARDVVTESASVIGRRWLAVIPFRPSLVLSDTEIATGLHGRTLCPGRLDFCSDCGETAPIGHDDLCTGRPRYQLGRHEQVKRLVINTLSSCSSYRVDVEPLVPGTQLRTDLRVSSPDRVVEIDITVVSLASQDARFISNRSHIDASRPVVDRAKSAVENALSATARLKHLKYAHRVSAPFRAFVLSSGGAADSGTLKLLDSWREHLGPSSYSHFIRCLSLSLVRSRARVGRL